MNPVGSETEFSFSSILAAALFYLAFGSVACLVAGWNFAAYFGFASLALLDLCALGLAARALLRYMAETGRSPLDTVLWAAVKLTVFMGLLVVLYRFAGFYRQSAALGLGILFWVPLTAPYFSRLLKNTTTQSSTQGV